MSMCVYIYYKYMNLMYDICMCIYYVCLDVCKALFTPEIATRTSRS